jgi:hypothetical protein
MLSALQSSGVVVFFQEMIDYLGSRVLICATRSLTLSLIAADTVVRPGLLGKGIAKLILLPAT